MIIPKSKEKIGIGSQVLTIRDIDLDYCVITKGHQFKIIEETDNGFIIKEIHDDNNKYQEVFTDIKREDLVLDIYLDNVRKEYNYCFHDFIQLMQIYCPKAGYWTSETSNYSYKVCLKDCEYSSTACVPTEKCIKYLKGVDINEDFEIIIRKLKIKNILK